MSHYFTYLKPGTHYPCWRLVFTVDVLDTQHGPWTRAVNTDSVPAFTVRAGARGRDVQVSGGDGDKTVLDRRVLKTLVDRGRRFAARQTRRIVHKDGSCNIASQNVTERRRRYLVDIFTTLVDMRWRYNVALFGAAFIVSWTTFAVVWFSIAYTHGDCDRVDDDDWQPCISNVHDFSTALLFSIETQTTIGYGSVYCVLRQLSPTRTSFIAPGPLLRSVASLGWCHPGRQLTV